jgi:thiamine biosynthesis protein ThiS
MKVYIERKKESKEITFSGKGSELLKKLKINPQTVLLAKNGEIVTEDETLTDKDTVKILSVVSGG